MLKKITFIFSSDFETFTKHTPCEILGLNFEKKTVYLNYNFVCEHSLLIMQNTSLRIWKLKTPVLHTK